MHALQYAKLADLPSTLHHEYGTRVGCKQEETSKMSKRRWKFTTFMGHDTAKKRLLQETDKLEELQKNAVNSLLHGESRLTLGEILDTACVAKILKITLDMFDYGQKATLAATREEAVEEERLHHLGEGALNEDLVRRLLMTNVANV